MFYLGMIAGVLVVYAVRVINAKYGDKIRRVKNDLTKVYHRNR